MHDRAFVGGDGVRAEFESGFDMVDGRLAGCGVERTGFENHVGASALDPLADVSRSSVRMLRGPVTVEDGQRIQAFGIDQPAGAACRDTGKTPAHVVAAAKLRFFGDKQAQERASYVAETDDRQVVGRNGSASEGNFAARAFLSLLFPISIG